MGGRGRRAATFRVLSVTEGKKKLPEPAPRSLQSPGASGRCAGPASSPRVPHLCRWDVTGPAGMTRGRPREDRTDPGGTRDRGGGSSAALSPHCCAPPAPASGSPARGPRDPPPGRVPRSPLPASPLPPVARGAWRSERRRNFSSKQSGCRRARPWHAKPAPGLLPRRREHLREQTSWGEGRGTGHTGQTGERHQLAPASLSPHSNAPLSPQGRRERARTHLAPTLPSRTFSAPGQEAALAPTAVNTLSGFPGEAPKPLGWPGGEGPCRADGRRGRAGLCTAGLPGSLCTRGSTQGPHSWTAGTPHKKASFRSTSSLVDKSQFCWFVFILRWDSGRGGGSSLYI